MGEARRDPLRHIIQDEITGVGLDGEHGMIFVLSCISKQDQPYRIGRDT
jgi:hypothetical protein